MLENGVKKPKLGTESRPRRRPMRAMVASVMNMPLPITVETMVAEALIARS